MDITKLPIEDGFQTTLAQEWDGSTGKVFASRVPESTLPSGVTTYIIVNPNRSNMQLVEVDGWDDSDNSFNVTNITLEKGAGLNYTQQSHGVGSVIRISDNYEFWKEIKEKVNSKWDLDGANGLEYADEAARDADLGGDGVATKNYRMVKAGANYYNYNLTTDQWEVIDTGTATPNASTTQAGVVQIATDAEIQAETDTGGTGAELVATPSQLSPTKLTEKASVHADDLMRIADSEDSDKAKSVKYGTIEDSVLDAIPDADTTTKGLVQRATDAEVLAGTNNKKFATAKQVDYVIAPIEGPVIFSQSGAVTTTETSYTKIKTINIVKQGTYRVVFDLYSTSTSSSSIGNGRVYLNGSAVGTERLVQGTGVGSPETFAQNFSLSPGDELQLYLRFTGSIGQIGSSVFRIEGIILPVLLMDETTGETH